MNQSGRTQQWVLDPLRPERRNPIWLYDLAKVQSHALACNQTNDAESAEAALVQTASADPVADQARRPTLVHGVYS